MAHQQLGPRLIDSQSAALDRWVREYCGLLGIALTDCITTDAFLRDFDLYFPKLDGLRHDSGDPLLWAEKTIAHYLKLGIDPLTGRPGVLRPAVHENGEGQRFQRCHGRA